MADQHITRDDALLWLNDRVGRSAAVYVEVEYEEGIADLLSCEGTLRHWRADSPVGAWLHPRDDLAGHYHLTSERGDVSAGLDLTNLRALVIRTHPEVTEEMQAHSVEVGLGRIVTEELVLVLSENVEMRVLVQEP
jgi:hypothetical protein